MIRPEKPEEQKTWLDKLPKLGRVSQLILLVGIFLIAFIPLWVIYQQQPSKQASLGQELSLLQRILAVPETQAPSKDKLGAELSQLEKEAESNKEHFPNPDQGTEIIDRMLDIAQSNDIDITQTQTSTSLQSIDEDKDETEWVVLTIEIDLTGQVAKFQNFLLDIDEELPTCEVNTIDFTLAVDETDEDTANLKIDVFCYASNE